MKSFFSEVARLDATAAAGCTAVWIFSGRGPFLLCYTANTVRAKSELKGDRTVTVVTAGDKYA